MDRQCRCTSNCIYQYHISLLLTLHLFIPSPSRFYCNPSNKHTNKQKINDTNHNIYTADSNAITWKSAILGNNDDVSISRQIPASAVKGAKWSVFGRSGHIRVQTTGEAPLHHELRFDGFPPNDFEKVKTTLEELYDVTLEKLSINSSGTSYGKAVVKGRNMVFSHMVLEDANEEGEEFEIRTGNEMLSLDLAQVSQCVLPGNNRNEIELQFPESDTLEAGTDQLGEFYRTRFVRCN